MVINLLPCSQLDRPASMGSRRQGSGGGDGSGEGRPGSRGSPLNWVNFGVAGFALANIYGFYYYLNSKREKELEKERKRELGKVKREMRQCVRLQFISTVSGQNRWYLRANGSHGPEEEQHGFLREVGAPLLWLHTLSRHLSR